MGRKEDLKVVRDFKNELSKKMPIKKVILFGSRVGGKVTKWSDFDIIIVSDKFNGIISYKRASYLYDYWKTLYPVDFLCYTSSEFNNLKKRITIVKQAIKEGIEII